jgi:hypothetical protein
MDQQLDNLKKKGSVTSGSSAGVDSAASTHFFDDAVLDHFSSSFAAPSQKWSQRYYVDSTFWKGEGYPVFLYIGGEGPQSAPSSRLFMWSLAEEHGALMLSLEHRFYGESQPTADMSVTNLAFLTSEQALADANRFIEYVKGATADDTQSTPALVLPSSASSSKVVAFGGSYPGNLATWIKLKYPASVVGSVGSSAPVFANYDYVQYAEVVGAALAYDTIGGSSECEATVAEGVAQLMALVNLTAPTWGTSDDIPEALKPCAGMDNLLDLSTYQSELFGNFQVPMPSPLLVIYHSSRPSSLVATLFPLFHIITATITATVITGHGSVQLDGVQTFRFRPLRHHQRGHFTRQQRPRGFCCRFKLILQRKCTV